jgi:hypothetical protein
VLELAYLLFVARSFSFKVREFRLVGLLALSLTLAAVHVLYRRRLSEGVSCCTDLTAPTGSVISEIGSNTPAGTRIQPLSDKVNPGFMLFLR